MNTARFWILCGVVLGLTCSAHARLGETVAQVEARYGKPDLPKKNASASNREPTENPLRHYLHDGIIIEVRFLNGISVEETYRQTVRDDRNDVHLSKKDIETILNANSNGRLWTDEKNGHWTCENGYTAVKTDTGLLHVKDPAKIQAAKEAKEKSAKPPAGF